LGFVVGASVNPKADSASAPNAASAAVSAQNIVALGDGIVELADQTKITFKDAVANWVASASEQVVMMSVPTHHTIE
jgi:hypothetical protein